MTLQWEYCKDPLLVRNRYPLQIRYLLTADTLMGLLEDVVDFSCLSPVFYFLLGVCVTIYFMLLLRSEKKTKLESADSKSAIQFYLNIFVLNKEEALDNVIKNKMKDRPKLISGLASSLANNLISEDKFVSNIGDKMTLLIPDKLTEMGIKCRVEKSYAHGNFVCVAINIISADARKGMCCVIVLYCIVLYCIVLYCIVLYCILH